MASGKGAGKESKGKAASDSLSEDIESSIQTTKAEKADTPSKSRFVPLEVRGEPDDFADPPGSKRGLNYELDKKKETPKIASSAPKKKAVPFAVKNKKVDAKDKKTQGGNKIEEKEESESIEKAHKEGRAAAGKLENDEVEFSADIYDNPPQDTEEADAVGDKDNSEEFIPEDPKQKSIASFFKKATVKKTDATSKLKSVFSLETSKPSLPKVDAKEKVTTEKNEQAINNLMKEPIAPAKKRGRPKKTAGDQSETAKALAKPPRKRQKVTDGDSNVNLLVKEDSMSFSEQLAQDPKSFEPTDDFPPTVPFKSEPSFAPTLPFEQDRIPGDWSLKTWARFKSPTPFDFVDSNPSTIAKALRLFVEKKVFEDSSPAGRDEPLQIANLNLLFETQSVQNSVGSNPVKASGEDFSAKVEFQKLLFYYSAPSFTFPQSLIGPLQVEKEKQMQTIERGDKVTKATDVMDLWTSTVSNWRTSFMSAFSIVLASSEPSYFYCLHDQFSFVALSPQLASSPDYLVVVTKSAKSLRDELVKAGVAFSMPLMPKNKVEKDDPALMEELVGMGKKIANQAIKKVSKETALDLTDESMLTIFGKENFERSAEVFSAYYAKVAEHSYALPVLYSRFPMVNSNLRSINIESKAANAPNQETGITEYFYQLVLNGPVFPEVYVTLCERIKRSQRELNANFEIDQRTLLLNRLISMAIKSSPSIATSTNERMDIEGEDKIPEQLLEAIRSEDSVKRISWTDNSLNIDYY